MSVHGLGRNNYNYANYTSPKAKGSAEDEDGKKAGKGKHTQKTDGYKPTYDYSDEVKKDMAFAKDNGLDYELIKKGQLYESREKHDSKIPFTKPEDYDKAIAEWNKFNEAKSAAEKPANGASGTTSPASDPKTGIYKPDMDKVREMKSDLKGNIGAFKQMVASLFKGQSGFASDAMKRLLNIDDETKAKAQSAISEDGEWGVNATATRILDFAKALSGGDPAKIETLKDAVMKGFKAAEKVWGGQLPGISYDTLQKVMDGFDEWAKTGQAYAASATEE